MNIAIFNRDKNSFGGQEQHSQYLANQISFKHKITYVTLKSKNSLSILKKNIPIIILNKIIYFFDETLCLDIFAKNFKEWLKTQDYLIVNNPLTLFAVQIFFQKKYNQKIITIFHSKTYSEKKIKNILNNMKSFVFLQIASIYSDEFVFLTKEDEAFFNKKIIFNKKPKYNIIKNGVETKIFSIEEDKKYFPKSIIFVGKLTKSKGVEDIIKIAKKMKLFKFTFVGKGPLEKEIIKQKNCQLKGILTQKEIVKEYRKHSVLILPSYSESFPLSIVEAMSSGLYIITSKIYGLSEIVLPELLGNSVVEPGDTDKIAKLLKEIFNNEMGLRKISKNNVAYAKKNFSIETMGKKYLELIKQ